MITHVFDLAMRMPAHLAIMFSMSWFGIPHGDPQGAGPDPSYGNTQWGGGCVATNDPSTCSDCVLMGTGDTCLQTGASQRDMASRRRPLAGIYSASALDTEGLRRVDLMLSNLRRPCDDGAKIDAWAVQMNGTHNTSLHPSNPSCTTCEITYDATLAFLKEADAARMDDVIVPAEDATFYFHFGTDVGLGACDDSSGNPKQSCIDALTQDFTDMATMALAHPSALKLGGNPVFYMYFDPGYLAPTDWATLLQNARNAAGTDFYVIASSQNATQTAFFEALDGISPWIQLDWASTSGSTVRAHAQAWTAAMHDPLYGAIAQYPGRVVLGAATPGFDDYTENWGGCSERQFPPGDARDPQVLLGEFDYFKAKGTTGLVMETWDDWTEGSEFEPDVAGGTSMLVSLRDQLGALYGEAADAPGDQRLADRWTSFGQARNCTGGPAGTSPVVALTCPAASGDAGTGDAGRGNPDAGKSGEAGSSGDDGGGGGSSGGGDAAESPDASQGGSDGAAPGSGSNSGCACATGSRGAAGGSAWGAALGLLGAALRRRVTRRADRARGRAGRPS
jgi:MYXO-CTERM domain-containing protein